MNATVMDLRKNMTNVLSALDRNEKVTLTYRGKNKAIIVPCEDNDTVLSASEHSSFGIWRDNDDIPDVDAYVRHLRKGRFS